MADHADEVGLRELTERLLAVRHPGWGGAPQAVQLLVGRLPDRLPLQLPLPPNARVLGSAVRRSGERMTGLDGLLDVPADAAEALALYQYELPRQGWNPAPSSPLSRQGGFQPAPLPTSASFCRSPDGPWISVACSPSPAGGAELRLHLELTGPGPCAQPPHDFRSGMPAIPGLHPPQRVSFRPAGGGGSPERWSSEAIAETERSAAELEAHFAAQLAAGGWTRVVGAAEGRLAWSLWRVPQDGDWQGVLLVLEGLAQNLRSLTVRVERVPGASGGWISSGWSMLSG